MTDQDQPDLNPDKVRQVIADAWNGLSPEDRAEREAYDTVRGIGGTTMHVHGDEIEFRRGGRTLAVCLIDDLL